MSLEEMKDSLSEAAEATFPDRDITFHRMFSGACAYANGRVFALLFDTGLALKLSPGDQAELLALPGARRFIHRDKSKPLGSKQYIFLPPGMEADGQALAAWVGRSIAFVETLPAPKARTPKPPRSKPRILRDA